VQFRAPVHIGEQLDSAGNPYRVHGKVIDGSGTELYRSPERTTFDSELDGDGNPIPVTATYTTPPSANPLVAGFYDDLERAQAFDTAHCDGLPFGTRMLLPPGAETLTDTLPVFDILVREPVPGIDVSALELGGTAVPTGATVEPLPRWFDTPGYVLALEDEWPFLNYTGATLYRVTITGTERDGTIRVRLPAGAVTSTSGAGTDTNAASNTVSVTLDTTGPTISGLGDVSRQLTPNETSATITWTAPVVEDPAGVASSGCLPASGSEFGPGDTTVTCTAADSLGNTATASFTVRVRAAQAPTVDVARDGGSASQGGTARFTVTATDYTGATGPLAASDYTVTSSVASDIIETSDGSFEVTFPHASPHVLTVTQLSTVATTQLAVEVAPAAVPAGPTVLSSTGADAIPPLIAAAILVIAGAALAASRPRRRA